MRPGASVSGAGGRTCTDLSRAGAFRMQPSIESLSGCAGWGLSASGFGRRMA